MSSWQPPHTHTTHVTRPVDTRIQYMLLVNTCKKHWTEAWNKSGIKTKFEVGTPGGLLQLCLQRTYLIEACLYFDPCQVEELYDRAAESNINHAGFSWTIWLSSFHVTQSQGTALPLCLLPPGLWSFVTVRTVQLLTMSLSLSLSPTPSVFYSLLRLDWIFVLVDLKEKKLKCHLHSDWFTFFPFWVDKHSQTVDKRPSVCLKTQRVAHLQQIKASAWRIWPVLTLATPGGSVGKMHCAYRTPLVQVHWPAIYERLQTQLLQHECRYTYRKRASAQVGFSIFSPYKFPYLRSNE